MTPEGRVKKSVRDYLATLPRPDLHGFWPVVTRHGRRTNLDYHGVYRGWPFVVEAKAPFESPTAKQAEAIVDWTACGCAVFVIDTEHPAGLIPLQKWAATREWRMD